jgi:tetratricopeptide (TPR) repeat protein
LRQKKEAHGIAGIFDLAARGNREGAFARLEEMLRAAPDSADLFNVRGLLRVEQMDLDRAGADFDAAVALAPEFAGAHNNRGHLLLMRGDYARGWPEYAWRTRIADYTAYANHSFGMPRWGGEPLAGRRILVHAEQGHGDTIQFARFLAPLAAQGASIDMFCQPTLVSLLSRIPGVRAASSNWRELAEHDFHAPLVDLAIAQLPDAGAPHWFGPYVSALPERVERFARTLAAARRPLVGIAWKGNPHHGNDANRSLTREIARQLLGPGITGVNLQVGEAPLDASMIDAAREIVDWEDTAALVSLLDHVVSVDTAVAHLAGAMGKPVTLLVAFTPDWRWRASGDTTPWYPSMRLARQASRGDWSGPIAAARAQMI